jgi:mono/diheme cytochrome c family protein
MYSWSRSIFSGVWISAVLVASSGGTAWTGSAGELKPLVPPEHRDQVRSLANPFPITEEFIANGKRVYEGKGWCAFCHGREESGQPGTRRHMGPPGVNPPTNFADAAWQAARRDGELFWVLIHGRHGTDMVPYMPMYITDKEAWQIIAYIRTLGGT